MNTHFSEDEPNQCRYNGSNGSRAAQLLCLGIPIRIKCPKAAKAMPGTGAGSLFWQPAAAVTGFVLI